MRVRCYFVRMSIEKDINVRRLRGFIHSPLLAGKQTMKLGWACILLTLAQAGLGDIVTQCSDPDVTALRDTLRQSACKLVPGRGNDTQTQIFRESVYKKHGQQSKFSRGTAWTTSVFFLRRYFVSILRFCKPLPTQPSSGVVPLSLLAKVCQHHVVHQHRLSGQGCGDVRQAGGGWADCH